MPRSFDVPKARMVLYYLGRAGNKLRERELAREKVRVAIRQIRKISTKEMKQDIENLERSIAQALSKEKRILAVQRDEAMAHDTLAGKIDMLQQRLETYLKAAKSREAHVRSIEQRVLAVTRPHMAKLLALKEGLVELERKYRAEKESGDYDEEELARVEQQIRALKARVKMLESQERLS